MVRRVFLISSLIAFVAFSVFAAPQVAQETVNLIEDIKLFSRAMSAIHEGYVGDTQPRTLVYEAARGMLASLGDKYAQFFDPSIYKLLKMSMTGEYAGIGVVLQIIDRYPQVMSVQPGGAAEKAGIGVGDRILAIDESSMENKELPAVAQLLRGDANTDVKLSLFRIPTGQKIEITLKREKIEIQSVKEPHLVSGGIGYLHIDNFQENTTAQVDQTLKKLDKQGLKALIIDLRGNGGGLLTQAVDLAGLFLTKGKPVVNVKSKIKEQQKEYYTSGKYRTRKEVLAILVNGESASASEIFSACLQDHQRASIIGTQTFGKASVQSVVPLDEQTAMKFTTARYMSPLGRMIDGVGITPDIVIEKSSDGAVDIQIVRAISFLREKIK